MIQKEKHDTNLQHKLFYMVYWKERRGAHLDKLMLCPLKLRMTKDLRFFFFNDHVMVLTLKAVFTALPHVDSR